jgi:GNAT superfamily N-acetyltransferase
VVVRTITYRRLGPDDAGEVLTVQRAAFVAEGRLYGNFDIPPLVESLEQVGHELGTTVMTGAFDGARLVGSIRVTKDGDLGWISRISVAPDQQGRGIGAGLIAAAEEDLPPGIRRLQLSAGAKSAANIVMYERRGYEVFSRASDPAGVEMVLMGKDLPPAG